MSVRCELYTLLLACVKLRLKIPISRSSCWFSKIRGSTTVLHLEARKELRRRPKTFNDTDTNLINELVPNSTTGSILSIHVYKIIVLMSTFVPRKTTPREIGQLFASAAFKEADQRETLKTQDVLFGELQSQKLLRFPTSALKNQTKTGVGASRNNNIKCDALECGSFEETIT